jgi:hypothetical protein
MPGRRCFGIAFLRVRTLGKIRHDAVRDRIGQKLLIRGILKLSLIFGVA